MKKLLLMGVVYLLLSLPFNVSSQIDCSTSTTFDPMVCYTNSSTTAIEVDICPGDPGAFVKLEFTAGEVEDDYDELEIYEGTAGSGTSGTQIYSGYGTFGDLFGLEVEGSVPGSCLSIYVVADGSIDCTTENFITPVFDASCVVPPSAPSNDLCENAIDLATLTSPYTSTTVGANDDDLQTCENGNSAPDIYFTIDVPDGQILTIGQTSNAYDSENYIGYGGECGEVNTIDCFDDPDTKTIIWQNCTGLTQTVVWVQDGYSSSSNEGNFTLAWSINASAIPACATANSPNDTATDVPIEGNITWSAAADACSYDVYLDQNNPPTTLLGNVTDLTIPYSGLLNAEIYNILIIPTNSTGDAVGCTVTSFTTIDPPPANDLCTTPSNVSSMVGSNSCGADITGTNLLATDSGEPSSSCAGSNYAGGDIWYEINVPAGETILNYERSASDFSTTYYELYSGSCGALVEEDCGSGTADAFDVTPGTTYLLRLFDWGNNDVGDVTFCLYYSCNITALSATPSACNPLDNTYSVDVTVTYANAPTTGNLSVNGQEFPISASPQTVTLTGLSSDGLDVDITAFFTDDTGCTLTVTNAFTAPEVCIIGCIIDNVTDGGNQSGCSFNGTDAVYSNDLTVAYTNPPATGTLDVIIDGITQSFAITASPQTVTLVDLIADGGTEDVTVQFSDENTCSETALTLFTAPADCSPPANDLCENAIDLATLTSPYNGTTVGANDDDLQSCAGGNTSPDIYFTIDVADGQILTIGQTSNTYDSENYVGYGGVCGELNVIDCYDDSDTKTVTWQNCTGATQTVVWVQDGYLSSSNAGNFILEWSIDELVIPGCVTANSPANASTNVSTSGNISWSSVANACSYDVYLDQNDPPTTLLGNVTDLTIPYSGLMEGETYNVLIIPTNATSDATGCTFTSFTTIDPPPANDLCSSAEVLMCGATDVAGTTTNATDNNPGGCSGGGDGTAGGVWYSITGTGTDITVTVNADPGNADDLDDSQLAIYSGTCGALVCEGGNDDSTPPGGAGSQVTFSSIMGSTYYVYVDGYSSNSGDFLISAECALPPIANAGGVGLCQNATPAMVDGTSAKVNLLVAGEIVAAINPNGQNLGMVDASYIRYEAATSPVRTWDPSGVEMMDRSIVITPTIQPTNPVSVFLYYSDAEYDRILLNPNVSSWSDMNITKFETDECSDMVDPEGIPGGGSATTYIGATQVTGGWEVEIEVSSFSGFQAAEGAAVLPIKLNRFTAKAEGRYNMIEWSTATELNVQDHTLMKSNNTSDWEVVGVKVGYANSNDNQDYSMIDAQPYATTYYQLMTTDLDGSVSYSPIVSVEREGDKASAFLGASPIPTLDVVNLNVYSQVDDNITITLTDISGKRLRVINTAISEGNHQLPLDLSNNTNGIYMVTITSDYIHQTHRVIKN